MSAKLKTPPLKYRRIAAEMREHIGALAPGDRIPSERDLAERFDCNVLTVRKSLAKLVEEGRIERRTGSGTFVTGAQAEAQIRHETGAATRSPQARGAVVGQIGVLALSETDRYGQEVIQALGRIATSRLLDLRLGWVQALDDTALAQAALMRESGCGAIILPWFPHAQLHTAAAFVRQCPLPVTLPMLIPGLERNCFEHPDCFGHSTLHVTDALCRYFAALGHRRIALLGPATPADPILQAKLSAYACTMGVLGCENLTGLVGPSVAAMDELAGRWAACAGDLAIIGYDDTHALRFITAMHKRGLNAPNDFVIVGSNNLEASRYFDPPLTSLCQDFDYVGNWLLRSAAALARGDVAQSTAPPPHRLMVRTSCGGAGRLSDSLLCDMTNRGLSLTLDDTVSHPR